MTEANPETIEDVMMRNQTLAYKNGRLQSQLAAALKRAEGAEAENAKLKQWPVPVWVWGNDEYPFGMEWQLDGDTFTISIEGGHVESTWFKGGKVHELKTWTDPTVMELKAELDELREKYRDAILEIYENILLEHSYPVGVPNADRMTSIEQFNHVDGGGYLYHSCMRDQEYAIYKLVEAGVYELHENGSWYRRVRTATQALAESEGGA